MTVSGKMTVKHVNNKLIARINRLTNLSKLDSKNIKLLRCFALEFDTRICYAVSVLEIESCHVFNTAVAPAGPEQLSCTSQPEATATD
jgi:hypothetical protein